MNKAKGTSILNVCALTILIDTLQIKHSFCLYIIYVYIYICLAKCTLEEALDANVSRPTLSHGMFSCSLQSLLATIEAQTAANTRIYGADSDVVKIDCCCFYYFVRNSLVALLEAPCIEHFV